MSASEVHEAAKWTYPEDTASPPSRAILSHPLELQSPRFLLAKENGLVS